MKKRISQEQKLVDSLLSGAFEIECFKIILTSKNEDNPHVYEGPGRLVSAEGRGVEIRVHWQGETCGTFPKTSDDVLSSVSNGKIVPRSAYYDLEAFDLVGRTWRGSGVWVDIELYAPSMTGMLLGSVSEIHEKSEISENKGKERQIYFKKIICSSDGFEFPCNNFTDLGVEGHLRNVAKFNVADDMECNVTLDDQRITVVISSSSPVSEQTSKSILAALEIVSGVHLTKIYTRERAESYTITKISPVCDMRRLDRLPGPFEHRSPSSLENVVKFIQAVVKRAEKFTFFYQLWRDIFFARQAGSVAFGLSASIAVEGGLKHYFQTYMVADEDFARLCREVIPFVLRLPEYTKGEFVIDEESFERILNKIKRNLNGASQTSAKNAVHKLFPRLADDWSKLRNPAAHGGLYLSPPDAQVLHDRTFTCLHIYYVMILAYLSFDGEFIDYSCTGYHRVEFSKVNPFVSSTP